MATWRLADERRKMAKKATEAADVAVADVDIIKAGQEAMQREMHDRAVAFNAAYEQLCQQFNCRHRPVAYFGFDGKVEWTMDAMAFPKTGK